MFKVISFLLLIPTLLFGAVSREIDANTITNPTKTLTLTLPTTTGSTNQCLKTDGSGVTSWTNCGTNTAADPVTFTPTVAGVTISSSSCTYTIFGKLAYFDCKIVSSALSATEARLTLPNSWTADSTVAPSIRTVPGSWMRGNTVASRGGKMLMNGGETYLAFSSVDTFSGTSIDVLNKINASSMGTAGDTFVINALVPITQLTSQSISTERLERFKFYTTSFGTVCSASPCGITTSLSGATITRAATGNYTLNFPSGTFSSAPTCVFKVSNGTDATIVQDQSITLPSSTAYQFKTAVVGVAFADSYGDIICTGPR